MGGGFPGTGSWVVEGVEGSWRVGEKPATANDPLPNPHPIIIFGSGDKRGPLVDKTIIKTIIITILPRIKEILFDFM